MAWSATTKPGASGASVGKRRSTPTTTPVTGRPSTLRAIRPLAVAAAAVAGSVTIGTGRLSLGCAGRTTPGAPLSSK